mgnify:CR=1 FL=1
MPFSAHEDHNPPLAKFESMLKTNDVYFFDSEDFQEITHHYLDSGKVALAKKAIAEMEKRKWVAALSTAKKARDKSIYKFIKWKFLLTEQNQASFYDYQLFINNNKNYPRIGRLKYLAEHKLSTKKISPKKVIKWFGGNEPLSGFGKLILGESLIGKSGEAITDLTPKGEVHVDGEYWKAVSVDAKKIPKESQISVIEVQGIVLKVKKI